MIGKYPGPDLSYFEQTEADRDFDPRSLGRRLGMFAAALILHDTDDTQSDNPRLWALADLVYEMVKDDRRPWKNGIELAEICDLVPSWRTVGLCENAHDADSELLDGTVPDDTEFKLRFLGALRTVVAEQVNAHPKLLAAIDGLTVELQLPDAGLIIDVRDGSVGGTEPQPVRAA